jgi:hypothetical protein
MKTIYKGDTRYEKVYEQMQLLGIQDVSTPRQVKNGTIEWQLPVKDQYGHEIYVASFASGYVRRTKAGGYCPSWQLNKRCESEPQYYKIKKDGETLYRKYTTRTCELIPNEVDRLEYLISFCLKNYYIGQANKLSSDEFIPKWKYEAYKDEHRRLVSIVNKSENPEVKVIVNGHRYNVI